MNTFQELKSIFPGLKLAIPDGESLKKVNEFEAREFSYKLGKIAFTDGNDVNTEINFWYLLTDEKTPIIVEFTLDYQTKVVDESNKMLLEEFSPLLVSYIDKLYLSLQKESIADIDTSSKTKTEYAYQYKA